MLTLPNRITQTSLRCDVKNGKSVEAWGREKKVNEEDGTCVQTAI